MSLEKLPKFLLNFSEIEMKGEKRHSYRFKAFRLEVEERQLLQNDQPISLTPKAFDVLVALVERSGHLVEKHELLRIVWTDSFVEEANVARLVHTLRKVLGDDGNGNKFIETVAKKGYRFVAKVNEIREPANLKLTDGKQDFLDFGETPPTGGFNVPGFKTEETIALPSVEPVKGAWIILFTAGLVTGIILFFLLLFDFQSINVQSVSSNVQSVSSLPENKVKSIAVLPLKPINTGVRDEIYEIGIAESMISGLGSMKGFVVRPLSATRQYTDINQDPIAAGREQRADYVLASYYQLADGKIRVTAQLINVASGQVEFNYKSEKVADDLFGMQDAIGNEVGKYIGMVLNRLDESGVRTRNDQ